MFSSLSHVRKKILCMEVMGDKTMPCWRCKESKDFQFGIGVNTKIIVFFFCVWIFFFPSFLNDGFWR